MPVDTPLVLAVRPLRTLGRGRPCRASRTGTGGTSTARPGSASTRASSLRLRLGLDASPRRSRRLRLGLSLDPQGPAGASRLGRLLLSLRLGPHPGRPSHLRLGLGASLRLRLRPCRRRLADAPATRRTRRRLGRCCLPAFRRRLLRYRLLRRSLLGRRTTRNRLRCRRLRGRSLLLQRETGEGTTNRGRFRCGPKPRRPGPGRRCSRSPPTEAPAQDAAQ